MYRNWYDLPAELILFIGVPVFLVFVLVAILIRWWREFFNRPPDPP